MASSAPPRPAHGRVPGGHPVPHPGAPARPPAACAARRPAPARTPRLPRARPPPQPPPRRAGRRRRPRSRRRTRRRRAPRRAPLPPRWRACARGQVTGRLGRVRAREQLLCPPTLAAREHVGGHEARLTKTGAAFAAPPLRSPPCPLRRSWLFYTQACLRPSTRPLERGAACWSAGACALSTRDAVASSSAGASA